MTKKDLATKVTDKMFFNDPYSLWLGIERLEDDAGRSVLRMTVRREMLNGFGIAHGGITYSLADSALAFASNSHGRMAVSVETSISHTAQVLEGDDSVEAVRAWVAGGCGCPETGAPVDRTPQRWRRRPARTVRARVAARVAARMIRHPARDQRPGSSPWASQRTRSPVR